MQNVPPPYPFALREVLVRLGVSQRRLARDVGVKQQAIARYFHGRYQPTWPSAVAIATALGVSLGVFSPGDPAHTEFFAQEEGAA